MPRCAVGWYIAGEFAGCKQYQQNPKCVRATILPEHLTEEEVCPNAYTSCESTGTGPGVNEDVIMYVTSQPRDTCGSTLASAAACAFDAVTRRPIAGNIIFCKINPEFFESDLATAVHEMLHVLVRRSDLAVLRPAQVGMA